MPTQYIIWNLRGNQRIYPHGRHGKSVFDSREEAERELSAFFHRMREHYGDTPVMDVRLLESEPDWELEAAVRGGSWNNAD